MYNNNFNKLLCSCHINKEYNQNGIWKTPRYGNIELGKRQMKMLVKFTTTDLSYYQCACARQI